MTHPTPGGFRGLLYVVRSFLRSFVRVTAVLAAKRAERHDHTRPRMTDRARPTAHDRPRTNDRPRTTDRAQPTAHDRPRTTDRTRPTAHDHARPTTHARPCTTDRARPRMTDHARTTAHDRPCTTTHDHARPRTTDHGCHICLRKRYPPHPRGFRGLNCLARLALARERTPSHLNEIYTFVSTLVVLILTFAGVSSTVVGY